jgi:hypothetical protein
MSFLKSPIRGHGSRTFKGPETSANGRLSRWSELFIAALALIALLAAEWILALAIPGTNYSQGDGKMAQAVILTAVKYGGIFDLTNINPLQGLGSQLLPLNVWANPAYWPFFVTGIPLASDVSAAIALGCLALGCYIMARCFDLPVLPSIVAAQLVIVLFGPLVRIILLFYQVFWINPGNAVVYASQLMALGALVRIEPGRIRNFVLAAGGLFASLLYSLACDPLWSVICGIGLFSAFAVVTLSPLRVRPILLRCAALGCCLVLLFASGALVYVYTLTQYTARVWFSDTLYYVPQHILASIGFIFPETLVRYYGVCAPGWLFGLLLTQGRPRVLVIAGFASFVTFVAYASAFLLASRWSLPVPIYVEHSLFPLFTTAAVAGYWAALAKLKDLVYFALKRGWRAAASVMRANRVSTMLSPIFSPLAIFSGLRRPLASLAALLVAVTVPAAATVYGLRASASAPKFTLYEQLPEAPELLSYVKDAIGLRPGSEFHGSALFVSPDDQTQISFWMQGVPTINEYSQLVTPQAMYFASLQRGVSSDQLNLFVPWTDGRCPLGAVVKTLQTLGVRYVVLYNRFAPWDAENFSFATFPRPPFVWPGSSKPAPGEYVIYELPNPNLGNYSPPEVVTAVSGAEFGAAICASDFDFTKRVVLSTAIDTPLVPAHNLRLSLIRGGLHVSGSSNGASLVVLPQQFSHCLSARDARVRVVRANLLLTGVVFSGDIDTDIVFDYGIFSPWCRLADFRDIKSLDLKIKAPSVAGGRLSSPLLSFRDTD